MTHYTAKKQVGVAAAVNVGERESKTDDAGPQAPQAEEGTGSGDDCDSLPSTIGYEAEYIGATHSCFNIRRGSKRMPDNNWRAALQARIGAHRHISDLTTSQILEFKSSRYNGWAWTFDEEEHDRVTEKRNKKKQKKLLARLTSAEGADDYDLTDLEFFAEDDAEDEEDSKEEHQQQHQQLRQHQQDHLHHQQQQCQDPLFRESVGEVEPNDYYTAKKHLRDQGFSKEVKEDLYLVANPLPFL